MCWKGDGIRMHLIVLKEESTRCAKFPFSDYGPNYEFHIDNKDVLLKYLEDLPFAFSGLGLWIFGYLLNQELSCLSTS